MSKQRTPPPASFRLPGQLSARIDALATRARNDPSKLGDAGAGVLVNKSFIVRLALAKGLDAVEALLK